MANLTPDEQRQQDETNAALARSQSFTDGRRRIVPVRDQTVTIGHGMLTFKANEIVEDLYRIALMESYGIEFVELNVNDRKKAPKADESKGEAIVRTDNVNALARGLGIESDVLRDALAGKQENVDRAVAIIGDAIVAAALPEIPALRAQLNAALEARSEGENDDESTAPAASDDDTTKPAGSPDELAFEPGTPAV